MGKINWKKSQKNREIMGLKKKQRIKLQKQGLKLYLQGTSKEEIARRLGVASKTIWSWSKKQDWSSYMEENEKRVTENIQEDVANEKSRTLRLIRATESIYAQRLQNGDIDVNPSNFAQIQRIKWEILTPKSLNQYNFMKQENNLELTKEEVNKLMEVL